MTNRIPEDPTERKIWVLAQLTRRLAETGIRPILVGGTAVALYTAGAYVTADMDVVASDRQRVGQTLREMGFQPAGRHWVHPQWEVAIEIPDTDLAGDPERVAQIEMDDGSVVYCIGIEDLLIDRLSAAVHWRSQEDRRWANELLRLHAAQVDWQYLRERAGREGVLALLEEMEREVHHRHAPDEME